MDKRNTQSTVWIVSVYRWMTSLKSYHCCIRKYFRRKTVSDVFQVCQIDERFSRIDMRVEKQNPIKSECARKDRVR